MRRKRERDKGDSNRKRKSLYRKRRQTGSRGREEGRGYGGDVRNINRVSGLPAGTHSAPNTYCHSD